MHPRGFREADGLTNQALHPRAQGQMLPLDFLRMLFAGAMHVRVQMPRVCAPMVGVKAGESKGLQERFELQKDLICAAPKDIRQDGSSGVIDGMPQPALVAFLADKTPHFIHFGFPSTFKIHGNIIWIEGAQSSGVDRLQSRFFLFELTEHGVRTDPEHARRIADPTGIEAHINDRVLHLGQAASVAVVEEKTAFDTRGVLAQVTLGAPGRFAAFDDLLTVTMRALNCDECHGPPLPAGHCQDEAQCDINFSPSPLFNTADSFD
jgi:hypothetical protein